MHVPENTRPMCEKNVSILGINIWGHPGIWRQVHDYHLLCDRIIKLIIRIYQVRFSIPREDEMGIVFLRLHSFYDVM